MIDTFKRRILRLWAKKNHIPMDKCEWFEETALFSCFLLNFELARLLKAVKREILRTKKRAK